MKPAFALVLACGFVSADVFLNQPRGSNNKGANDNNQAVENRNRLFRSRNNPEGGTHMAPPMYYYEGSSMMISWTSDNGCGKDGDTHCEFILQYMCDPLLRDGTTSTTIPLTVAADTDTQYGRHESYEYYKSCMERTRNKGLFLADSFLIRDNLVSRIVQHEQATYTRQTCWPGIACNVDRYGFECPEERDYYPYWHPSPWMDIAVFVDDLNAPHPWDPTKTIVDFYESETQNIRNKGWCKGKPQENNKNGCEQASGTWMTDSGFGLTESLRRNPDGSSNFVFQNKVMRPGHLGSGPDGYEHQFMWTVPNVGSAWPGERGSSRKPVGADEETIEMYKHCAMRIRLNVTSDDYPRWTTFEDKNSVPEVKGLVTSEEYVDMPCATEFPTIASPVCSRSLSIAAATPMLGTVFEDRSWEFEIRPRPKTVLNRIHNLNVIGRRGNIVQTYPSVEYDFRPNELVMTKGEWLHPQWTGSDSNPANQAGEGRDETDRCNIVQIKHLTDNHPIRFQEQRLFATTFQATRHAFADSMETSCRSLNELLSANANDDAIDEDVQNCGKLNAPYVNYFDGDLQKMDIVGTFYYMSSRNNNFSNRSQKGTITVLPCDEASGTCPVKDYITYIPGDRFTQNSGSGAGQLIASLGSLFL